jgi:hypothetical protein
MLGAAPELGRALGDVDVDAQIGRQMSTALAILDDRRSSGRLPAVVIVHLGNNGPLTTRQVNAMFDILASVKHVVVLTFRIPDDFQAHNNRLLVQITRERPNAILFDWHAATEGRSDLFWNDGEHLRPQGADVYASLIASVLHDHGIATR